MRVFVLALLMTTMVAAGPATAGDPSQPGSVLLALTVEVKPAGEPQPPAAAGTAGSLSVSPAASSAPALATVPPPAPATGASSFTDEADPSETATTTPPEPIEPPVTKLVVAGWGGAYGQALRKAVLDPFHDSSKLMIETVAASAAALPASTLNWDVADVSPAIARQACDSGAVAELDVGQLSPSAYGLPAAADFLDGSLSRCAVGSFAWSSLVLIDPKAFRKNQPATLADVFDGRRFKQKRAFARSPRYLLEMALLADGVPPGRVYGELSTREGLKRAFKRLDGIRKHIVWSDKPETALKQLGRGDVGFATAFSGRAFYAMASELKPYKMIWDGQIYDLSVWVVSSRSASLTEAKDFVSFATRPDRLAAMSRWYPYGPVRLSALDLVGQHPTLGLDLKPFLPTAPDNMATALKFNELFWRHNEAALQHSLELWIKGESPVPPAPPATGAAVKSF